MHRLMKMAIAASHQDQVVLSQGSITTECKDENCSYQTRRARNVRLVPGTRNSTANVPEALLNPKQSSNCIGHALGILSTVMTNCWSSDRFEPK